MKQLTALQQQGRRSNSFRGASSPLDAAVDGSIRSPVTIFWLVLHGLCCLISLVLGFRFSRIVFFLLFSTASSPSTTTIYTALQTTLPTSGATSPPERNVSGVGGGSRVVVGRHGILIRPWPHPDPAEVMKAHKIIERVQLEQRSQYGVKGPRTVIAVTPTYVRTFQTLHLTGLMHSLMNVPYDVIWVVVEAGGATNETAALISKSGLRTIHIGFDAKMPVLWEDRHKLESKMRLHALSVEYLRFEVFEMRRLVREKRLDGIVMFADERDSEEEELPVIQRDDSEKDDKNPQLPIQVVLPRKLEWAGFVLDSKLVWEDADKPDWVKVFEEVSRDGEDVESPLSFLNDASVVEPLGSCGRKVLLWWLRVEARADSKFPARWIIDPPLDITVPAKRTPWPDAPPELPSSVEKVISIQETTDKRASKSGSRRKRSSRSKRKHTAKVIDEHASTRHSGDN
ncbi:Beta-1,4-xylosyltransferase IRX14 [Sesamum angolense]|uniref:Glycosyltransferases n=1 Tax=Sesamum angolense TaxID=2727404 RepID=A0AAE1XEM6_9LAMI|nr:Beta-1,4-xylosyltransferase IRX14 [Sesamum angolense]